jgi:hypothetical protein
MKEKRGEKSLYENNSNFLCSLLFFICYLLSLYVQDKFIFLSGQKVLFSPEISYIQRKYRPGFKNSFAVQKCLYNLGIA